MLAPTYVASGVNSVGNKPTVQFSAVNVHILNGQGTTASLNGEGNLVIGYDESPGSQSGSHNLLLGANLDCRSGNSIESSAGGEAVAEGAAAPPGDLDASVLVAGFE